MEINWIYNDYGMYMGHVNHNKKTDTYTIVSHGNFKTFKTMKDFIEYLDALDWFVNQNDWVDKSYLVD